MEIIEFYKKTLTAPENMNSVGQYGVTTLALLAPCLLLLWIASMGIYLLLRSNREDLGSVLAVKLGWAWGSIMLGMLLFFDIIILWILTGLSSWSASSPHLSLAFLGGIIGTLVYLGARKELKTMQRAIFRAQGAR